MARQIMWIPTPYAVYAATYDASGRLWFGGGFWYGSGFLGCADPDGATRWYGGGDGWSHESPPTGWLKPDPAWGSVAVSGLWLTPDAHHVALSMWGASHRPHAVRVFALDEQGPHPAYDRHVASEVAEAASGMIVHRGHLWLRQLAHQPDRVLVGMPSSRLDRSGGIAAALASRRLVALDDTVVTGWNRGLLLARPSSAAPELIGGVPDVGRHREWSAGIRSHADGRDFVDDRSTVVLGTRDRTSSSASAITADDAGTHVTAGFRDGAIAWWTVTRRADRPELTLADVRPAHRFPIAAACQLPSGDELTADRGGWLHHWRDRTLVSEWRLPTSHSPRTLAADPIHHRVAIGCKHGHGGPSPGGIAIVQL